MQTYLSDGSRLFVLIPADGARQYNFPDEIVQKYSERSAAIISAHKEGCTLHEIGLVHGISRERVRQILKDSGFNRDTGGKTFQVLISCEDRKEKKRMSRNERDLKASRIYGAPYSLVVELNNGELPSRKGSLAHSYMEQRRNSIGRGIEFDITFPDWINVWKESGHIDERGRGANKYCMARILDSGGYKVGNVEIKTNQENASEQYLVVSAKERREKARKCTHGSEFRAKGRYCRICRKEWSLAHKELLKADLR